MTAHVRLFLCAVSLVAVAGCTLPEGEPLVSAQYPPGTGAVNANSEPQPLNSIPVGAANYGPSPFATQPDFLSFQIGGR